MSKKNSSKKASDKGKDSTQPKAHFTAQKNGVIRVAQAFDNITAAYTKADAIPDYLAAVDHSHKIEEKKEYQRQLDEQEEQFNLLVRRMHDAKKFLVVVLQGRDGAGKSGATICIGESLGHDAKLFLSVPIGPPTEEERAHPPLWRFFKDDRMPAYGQVRVFDRSWAEEVLVVRVNKIKPKPIWQKSYASLRTMDWMLEQEGGIVCKIWFDITKDEQKARFKKRKEEKPWKVSPSDAEARKKWKQYTAAANEMFYRTGTDYSPWYIISSEDKRYSRVNVLSIINQQLRDALGDK